MKKLLILGNGYDIACGLKTRFSDFHNYFSRFNQPFEKNFFYFLLNETFFKKDGSYKEELCKLLKVDSILNWMDFELLLNHFLFESPYYDMCKTYFDKRVKISNMFTHDLHGVENLTACFFNNIDIQSEIKDFECFLSMQLLDFERHLCAYLNLAEENNHFIDSTREEVLSKIIGTDECVGIITFNYTNPSVTRKLPVKYVHGNCYGERNIIIGVDFTLNNKTRYVKDYITYENIGYKRMFHKTYRKLILEHDTKERNSILSKDIQKLTFYGHSLGEQDYSYFQSLFDYYQIYDSNVKLEFLYSNYDGPGKEMTRTLDRVYKLINEYGKTLENEDHGKNLLHKMMLEERILINKI